MKYEFNPADLRSFAFFQNAKTKELGDEMHFEICPYCEGGEHHDKNTFSVNTRTGMFKCLRSSCDKHGAFVTLARDFGFALDFGDNDEKVYRKLPQKKAETKPEAVQHLQKRGIGEATVKKYGITVQKSNTNILVFPFYNEEGVLTTVKYRKADFQKGVDKNKEWFESGTEPILFGMHVARNYKEPLVITEGQIDALSLAEVGVQNVTSVPNGCTSFGWIKSCYSYVARFPSIVVMGDCEKGKITLVEKISKAFQKPVYYIPPDRYYGAKDANEILQSYGAETLLSSFRSAVEFMPPHILQLADVEPVDYSTLPRIRTGVGLLDKIIGGLYFGQLCIVSGKRGEGKSTLVGQIILEAVEQGYSTLAYSGELSAGQFRTWLDFQAAGPRFVKARNPDSTYKDYYVEQREKDRISSWYRGKVYLYDNESVYGDEKETVLQTIESAVTRFGIQLVVIDNLMTAMESASPESIYYEQGAFAKNLKNLALRLGVVVVLVAHMRKFSTDRQQKDMTDADSIAGSGELANRADTIIAYGREPESEDGGGQMGLLYLTKNRTNGRLITKSPIRLKFDPSCKRLTEEGLYTPRKYGWEAKPYA